MKDDQNLEKTIEKLEKNAELLKRGDISIDESVKVYEECLDLFKHASALLDETKQKIQVYDPENDSLEDFEYV